MGDRARILHVEDDQAHGELIRRAIAKLGLPCQVLLTQSRKEYLQALDESAPDLILSDSRAVDFEGLEALRLARQRYPSVPFLFVCTSFKDTAALKAAGATDCLPKSDLEALTRKVASLLESPPGSAALDFKRLFEASPDILLVL